MFNLSLIEENAAWVYFFSGNISFIRYMTAIQMTITAIILSMVIFIVISSIGLTVRQPRHTYRIGD